MPPRPPFVESKSPFLSRTIIAAALIAVASIIRLFGFDLDDETRELATDAVFTAITVIGSIVAILGRIRATKKIGSGGLDTSALPLVLLAFTVFTVFAALGCAGTDRRGRVTNAVLGEVARFAGRVALASFTDAAAARGRGESIDLAHSAAAGLWTQAPTIIDAASLSRITDAWSGGALAGAGEQLGAEFTKIAPATFAERMAVVGAMAQGISSAAVQAGPPSLKPPAVEALFPLPAK